MFLLILAYLFHYWWYKKNKKLSTEYFPIPPSRRLAENDHYSNNSEPFSIPSSLPSEMESHAEVSVILNLAEMDTLPLIKLLPYNGFKLTPSDENQTSENISNLFSEGDFIRNYLIYTSTTHQSRCELQKATFSQLSPSSRAKTHSLGKRNPADFSISYSSTQKCPKFPQHFPLSGPNSKEQETNQQISFEMSTSIGSKCKQQETSFTHQFPGTRAKSLSKGIRNPADFSSSQSSASEHPKFLQHLRSPLLASRSKEERHRHISANTLRSKEISLNFSFFPSNRHFLRRILKLSNRSQQLKNLS
ncbi:hypothetical protein NPIL_133361 [Nephila pilipes]|uniref:Uncharacterized protein n=1 Tax=Nephila pilipes TaxID=299642 RepID=A0A8X6QB45_NEPPI|nr:hypothetical protein NPIL_133361 [Nephila pilipes]